MNLRFRWTAVSVLAVLLALNAVAIGTLVTARGRAKDAAARELRVRAERHAAALEASLAATRGDLLFLAQSRSIRRLLDVDALDDPYRDRWDRLDAGAAGLLFLRSHPEIERLVVAGPGDDVLIAVGRRGGVPITLPLPPAGDRPLHSPHAPTRAPLDVRLLVDLSPDELLRRLATGHETYELRARALPDSGSADAARAVVTADVPVLAADWDPPIAWTLRSRQTPGDLTGSLEHLARDFRNTVLLNVVLVALASILGWLAFREVRTVERLKAEQRNLARVRELELGLMHRDRLASLGRITAGIAHEINNPLEGMSNYLRLVEDDLAESDTGAARAHLAGVNQGLEHVAGIVRQTLARAGDGRGAKETLDLRHVVRRTITFAREDPKLRGVALREISPTEGVPVLGNATTLGQLVLNLILNAGEAQPDGGEVEIHTAKAEGRAVLTVADRGPGFGHSDTERVFEPFFSTKGSTGLGLFLCHAIADDHGGTLTAENREGGGATVVLALPLARSEVSA